MHNPRTGSCSAFDFTDYIDVIDLLLAGYIKDPSSPPLLNAAHDDITEITHVQRLAHIPAATWDREQRQFLHKTGQPAEVLAIKPSIHQSRPQYRARQTAVQYYLFLLPLGLRVKIVGD